MIIGAGLAGLLAAYAFPKDELWEERKEPSAEHQALLRFSSPAVSDLTGIPFERVTVRKGIWYRGGWAAPAIQACNAYALKVVGAVVDRSIWNLEPCVRWIPPHDFYERMVEAIGSRIHWGERVPIEVLRYYGEDSGKFAISTAPLPALAEPLCFYNAEEFKSMSIVTSKVVLECRSDVQQTVYFPDDHHGLYRATLSGNVLTLEWVGDSAAALGYLDSAAASVAEAFGYPALHELVIASTENLHKQRYGKLLPIDELPRKKLLIRLTEEHGIYSLGRFATWRNIMLDDVVHDIAVIKRLASATTYERHMFSFGEKGKEK